MAAWPGQESGPKVGNETGMQPAECAGSAALQPGTKVSLALVALCLLVLAVYILRSLLLQVPGARDDIASIGASFPPGRVTLLGMSRERVEARMGVPRRVVTRKTSQGRWKVYYYQRRRGPGFLRVEYQDGVAETVLRVLKLP